MPAREEEIAATRREIIDLLRRQMEALDSPLGLTDERLSECYQRQERVQELRERLQALVASDPVASPVHHEVSSSAESMCGVQPRVPADAVVGL